MEKKRPECHHPVCIFAHDLVNQLAVIVGRCDLLLDPKQSEAERARQLKEIHDTVWSMARKLAEHRCQLALVTQIASPREQERIS